MRRQLAIRQSLAAVGFLLLLGFLAATLTRCASLPGADVSDTELAYRASLLRCVDKAKTLAESKACRHEADLKYLALDGGAR